MTLLKQLLVFPLLFLSALLSAQDVGEYLRSDIEYLASDELGGRLAGSDNEKLAANFIKQRFEEIGLGTLPQAESFFMPFTFSTPIELVDGKNYLECDGKALDEEAFYVVPVSGDGKVKGAVIDIGFGISAPELDHDDLKDVDIEGKIILVNLGSPDGVHPHSRFLKYNSWRTRIELLAEKHPAAILCYNSNSEISVATLRRYNNLSRLSIPVLYLEDSGVEKVKPSRKLKLNTLLNQEQKESLNVLAFLDKGSDKTVVIGAHYDHLGLGEYCNSRYIGPPAIHNGADDNASGVALMLSLAQKLKEKEDELSYNYLFMAFSAEELGLLGSKAFVNTEVFRKHRIHYMLNFDMVGRLNEQNELGIFGSGTSSTWPKAFEQLDTAGFTINRNPSGMGSSDHTSFYLNDIPVLHFFTGTHVDYHKPSDDIDKINIDGMARVLTLATQLCLTVDDFAEIDFVKTKSNNSRKAPSFKVTLGIMPDYFGDDLGLKIDGVSPGKPAEVAGLKKGDIIIRMGETPIKDMMSYMEALANYDKGDNTIVVVLREGKQIELQVAF